MTDKGKAKDAAAKAKLAAQLPALVRANAKSTGASDEQTAPLGAAIDSLVAPYAPNE